MRERDQVGEVGSDKERERESVDTKSLSLATSSAAGAREEEHHPARYCAPSRLPLPLLCPSRSLTCLLRSFSSRLVLRALSLSLAESLQEEENLVVAKKKRV